MQVNFRTIADLNRCIIQNLHRIPTDTDLVVGIPRSGLLAANLIALYLNRPLTDLEGLLEGRLIQSGIYRGPTADGGAEHRRILLVDDSVRTGREMRQALARIREAGLDAEVTSIAVYVAPECAGEVDVALELVPAPRYFEWNLMHHTRMPEFCVDMDGVLCIDPSEAENDDGSAYDVFLRYAKPQFLPSQCIGAIVTCRLEKYRPLTEAWLREHGLAYDRLIMMDLPDRAARAASGSHAAFKAQAYAESGAILFIESSLEQAREITRLSGKPVVCLEQPQIVEPSALATLLGRLQRARRDPRRALSKSWSVLQTRLAAR